jgi:hypothetical protein
VNENQSFLFQFVFLLKDVQQLQAVGDKVCEAGRAGRQCGKLREGVPALHERLGVLQDAPQVREEPKDQGSHHAEVHRVPAAASTQHAIADISQNLITSLQQRKKNQVFQLYCLFVQ